jgi:hypothetical protein
LFCVHLLCCFAGLTLLGNASMLNGWRQAALLSGTLAAMLITAKFFAKSEAKHERKAKPESSPGPRATIVRTTYVPRERESKEAERSR